MSAGQSRGTCVDVSVELLWQHRHCNSSIRIVLGSGMEQEHDLQCFFALLIARQGITNGLSLCVLQRWMSTVDSVGQLLLICVRPGHISTALVLNAEYECFNAAHVFDNQIMKCFNFIREFHTSILLSPCYMQDNKKCDKEKCETCNAGICEGCSGTCHTCQDGSCKDVSFLAASPFGSQQPSSDGVQHGSIACFVVIFATLITRPENQKKSRDWIGQITLNGLTMCAPQRFVARDQLQNHSAKRILYVCDQTISQHPWCWMLL